MADKIKYTTKDASYLNKQAGPRPDTGYMVNSPNISANDSDNWTIQLIKSNKKYLNLWVEEITVDFSMFGSTGQSRHKREFYPHSFNEPTLRMTGRMPNQREFNKLAAFVRESHSEALNGRQNISETGKGTKVYPTVTLLMKGNPPSKKKPRTQKGGRRGMKLEGYIKSVTAGAKKFEFAPMFQIDFIVAASDGTVGIYEDKLDAGSQTVDWMTLFKEGQFGAKSGYQIKKDIVTYNGSNGAKNTGQDTPQFNTPPSHPD
jgi:hypothetical protein